MGKRSIDVQCFRGNLDLFMFRHGVHGEHIMVSICDFYDNHPNVIMQGQQHLSEILRLLGDIHIFFKMRYFGKPVDNPGHRFTEHSFNII